MTKLAAVVGLEPTVRNGVQVQVLFPAPNQMEDSVTGNTEVSYAFISDSNSDLPKKSIVKR